MCSSVSTVTVPLRAGTSTGVICSLKYPAVRRGGRAAVAFHGERILISPGDTVLGGDVLRGDAHVTGVEGVGERADHSVDHGAILHPLPPAHGGQPVLSPAHRLRAAGDRDLAVAEPDSLCGRHDRLQSAAAQPVQRERGGLHPEPAVDRGHPGQVHVPYLGMDHIAEDRMTDRVRIHARPADRLPHHGGGQVARRDRGEPAAVFADRCPGGGQDEDIVVVFHGISPVSGSVLTCPGRR